MDVVPWIIWGIVLDDPIHTGYIKATSGNVRTQQSARFCVAKFEECRCPLLLLLFTLRKRISVQERTMQINLTDMKVEDRDIDIIE